jgi:hypothetical protein
MLEHEALEMARNTGAACYAVGSPRMVAFVT